MRTVSMIVASPRPKWAIKVWPGHLIGHLDRREFAQLLINERKQLFGGFGIALLNAVEDVRDVAHASFTT